MPQTWEQPLNDISSGFEPDTEFPAASMAHPPGVLTCVCRVVGTSPIEELAGVSKANLMCQEWNDLVFAHGGSCNQRRENFPGSYLS